jgi:hypothetical protein
MEWKIDDQGNLIVWSDYDVGQPIKWTPEELSEILDRMYDERDYWKDNG